MWINKERKTWSSEHVVFAFAVLMNYHKMKICSIPSHLQDDLSRLIKAVIKLFKIESSRVDLRAYLHECGAPSFISLRDNFVSRQVKFQSWMTQEINKFLITYFMLGQLSERSFLDSCFFIALVLSLRKIAFDWHEKCFSSYLFKSNKSIDWQKQFSNHI